MAGLASAAGVPQKFEVVIRRSAICPGDIGADAGGGASREPADPVQPPHQKGHVGGGGGSSIKPPRPRSPLDEKKADASNFSRSAIDVVEAEGRTERRHREHMLARHPQVLAAVTRRLTRGRAGEASRARTLAAASSARQLSRTTRLVRGRRFSMNGSSSDRPAAHEAQRVEAAGQPPRLFAPEQRHIQTWPVRKLGDQVLPIGMASRVLTVPPGAGEGDEAIGAEIAGRRPSPLWSVR